MSSGWAAARWASWLLAKSDDQKSARAKTDSASWKTVFNGDSDGVVSVLSQLSLKAGNLVAMGAISPAKTRGAGGLFFTLP